MTRQTSHETPLDYAAHIISALDSEQRLQIINLLRERDHVVHEIVKALGKSQPLISQHLRVLKKAGLVTSTRSGREVLYKLSIPEVSSIIDLAAKVGQQAENPTESSTPYSNAAIAGEIELEQNASDLIPSIPVSPAPNAQ